MTQISACVLNEWTEGEKSIIGKEAAVSEEKEEKSGVQQKSQDV